MRAVVLDVDRALLAERRRRGLDKWDEMWEGVLHMVPPPSARHQRVEDELWLALRPAARRCGLMITTDTGVFANDDDYKVPDIVAYSPEAASERAVEGAPELVVEVRSPGDESYDKVGWYLGRGAKAVLVVDRDTLALELYRQDGRVPPAPDGAVVLGALGVVVAPSGPTLVVDGAELEI